jgi:hypothetical protein
MNMYACMECAPALMDPAVSILLCEDQQVKQIALSNDPFRKVSAQQNFPTPPKMHLLPKGAHIMLRDLLTQKCAQKKDFGCPRACRFRKHQIENKDNCSG